MNPAIREADVEDAGILSVLATEVWLDTYATEGVSFAFAAHLLEEYSPKAFTETLLNESIHIFVYTDGNFVKGYLKVVTDPVALDLRYGTVEVGRCMCVGITSDRVSERSFCATRWMWRSRADTGACISLYIMPIETRWPSTSPTASTKLATSCSSSKASRCRMLF